MSTTACTNNPPLTSWAHYNVSNSNRMDTTNQNANQGTNGYDAAGDVTNDGVNTYLYDAEGRICAVSSTYDGTTTMTGYLYDGRVANPSARHRCLVHTRLKPAGCRSPSACEGFGF
jgi:hypothetical protein